VSDEENPFVRFGLDPSATLAELTTRLAELVEDASSDDERRALRAAWETLARSPARRLELAFAAGPSPAPLPLAVAPRLPAVDFEPTLADVLAPMPLGLRLPPETDADRARRLVDPRALVRDDEIAITGSLERTRSPR
jgi:hypothetical protein